MKYINNITNLSTNECEKKKKIKENNNKKLHRIINQHQKKLINIRMKFF